jgi:hypothetical protein
MRVYELNEHAPIIGLTSIDRYLFPWNLSMGSRYIGRLLSLA